MNRKIVVLIAMTLLLAACGSAPQRKTPGSGGYLAGDGPGADIPVNLDAIPDAVPKSEPLHRYANRSYIALGKTYTPLTTVGNFKERGIASWYGKKFNGEKTSSGETYDMYAMTAAHPTLPLPSYARVTNLSNNKSVIVRVNDRGPFLNDRVIDLSYTAAYKLGIISDGSAEVEVVSLNPDVSINTIAANSVQSQPLESSTPVVPATATATDAASPAAAPAAVAVPVAAAAVAAPASAPLASKSNAVYLQLGAFSSQAGAEAYRDKMSKLLGGTGKQLMVTTNKDGLLRVNIGPYANLGEARSSAEGMEADLGFKPMVNLP